MPIINTKDLPELKTIRLIDLTEDSINHIADAVVSKLNKSMRHGHWVEARYPLFTCSVCGATYQDNGYGYNYCPNCGAKMDEVEE